MTKQNRICKYVILGDNAFALFNYNIPSLPSFVFFQQTLNVWNLS